jgi:tetratricopeptide (TPR) repeat protein
MISNNEFPLTVLVGRWFNALRYATVGALLICIAAGSVTAVASALPAPVATRQDKPPKVADEQPSGEKKDAGKGNNVKPIKGDPKAQATRPPRHVPPPLEVLFVTNVPDAEVFINPGGAQAQLLGKTDSEGKLATRLARGRHNVMASKQGHRIVRQQIVVRQNNQTFDFNLAMPVAIAREKSGDETPPPTTEPSPTPDAPAQMSDADEADDKRKRVEEIMKRFLDAEETGRSTSAEWELVLSQTGSDLAQDPANSDLQAQALFAKGQIAYMRGDYPNALVNFNKATLANPKMLAALYGLGNAYLATNQAAEAIKSYQRATQLDAHFALALKGMADALTAQGKTKDAAAYYERFKIAGGQTASDPNLNAALALLKRKRWAQALKEFEGVSKYQNTSEIYVYIGDCYVGLEKPLSASQAYLKAVELDNKSPLAHFKYGEVMFSLREYSAAMEAFERALALDLTGASINRGSARKMANKSAELLRKAK